ncbi:MAG: amidohydrolase family protein, partial [Alistipes sp.]|nr:amidohydrolase family protein [Candidatus Minthomonas equi]
MKRILICITVLLCVAGCQKYDDTQLKEDIKNLQEQTDSRILIKDSGKQVIEAGDEIELILSPCVTKDSYGAIKAEISSSMGTETAVATKSGNTSSWKLEVKNPEFGDDGKVTKNPVVVILQTVPGYSNDAVLTVTLIDNTGATYSASKALTPEKISADLVVYGKIFTSDNYELAEAFAVKDGKYIYVGDRESAAVFVEEGRTQVIDYSEKGLVMPSCGDGHAHYMTGYGFKSVGTMIENTATVDDFLKKIVPEATKKAKDNGSSAIFGFGWNYFRFKDNMPTRQDLDKICDKIPMYFADEEGHKGLANTICLVKAGILSKDGKVLKKGTDIRGGEIMVDANGIPNGFVKEQAGTYVRSALDNDNLYTVAVAADNLI